jgi:hypothetical protein
MYGERIATAVGGVCLAGCTGCPRCCACIVAAAAAGGVGGGRAVARAIRASRSTDASAASSWLEEKANDIRPRGVSLHTTHDPTLNVCRDSGANSRLPGRTSRP